MRALTYLVLFSGLVIVCLLMNLIAFQISTTTAKEKPSRQQAESEKHGTCLTDYLVRCPVCSAATEAECDAEAKYEFCNTPLETCSVAKAWTVKGNLKSVTKGCIASGQCKEDDHCKSIDGGRSHICVTCSDKRACEKLHERSRRMGIGALCLLIAVAVLYIIRTRRRRRCPDAVWLCADLPCHSSASSTAVPSPLPRLAFRYRYQLLA